MSVAVSAPSATLPRLLDGVPAEGAMTLDVHLAVHGVAPWVGGSRRASAARSPMIDEVARAGLCGRGGGGFPTAIKMRAVADAGGAGSRAPSWWAPGRRPIVVVNAAEGEPASLKDRTLLEALPHLVLDGAALSAEAVGADEAIVCVCSLSVDAQESVERAIVERGGQDRVRFSIADLPARYVAGQESALVRFLSGGPALPIFTPPMPFERGVRQRPTLVNNPETLAHVALIARYGAGWFRQLGTASQPGSALVTLGGAVAGPGVYEIEHGASLASLIDAAGGATEELRAVLIGGYAGAWVDARHLPALALADEQLAPYGARLGTGVVVLLGESGCGPAETARVTRWLARESAGQCGPCVHGLGAIATCLEGAVAGVPEGGSQRIAHLLSIVSRRGACSHPDGTARFVESAVEVFAEELAEHARNGPCLACATANMLPLPASRRGGPR